MSQVWTVREVVCGWSLWFCTWKCWSGSISLLT